MCGAGLPAVATSTIHFLQRNVLLKGARIRKFLTARLNDLL
jgi:hypothetical protein